MTATQEQFFKKTKVSQDAKATTTNDVARQIISQEAQQRDKKTAMLRQLREAKEAENHQLALDNPEPATKKKSRSKAK